MVQRRVRIRNLSVIEMILVRLGIRRGWLVGVMWIIQMHPNETGSHGVRIQPGLCSLHHVHPSAFKSSPSRFGVHPFRKVVVKLESPIESGSQTLAVQNYGPYKCRRLIGFFLE